MVQESYCENCDETTETDYREMVNNYVAHICVECGADKRDDPKAPV